MAELTQSFQKRGVFASWAMLRTDAFANGANYGIQALGSAFFKPNILFLNLYRCKETREDIVKIIQEAIYSEVGVLLFAPHIHAGFGQRQYINVWIRDRSPSWKVSWDIGNLDLSILIAYKLKLNWNAKIRLITVITKEEEYDNAKQFMADLVDLARLPNTEIIVKKDNFMNYLDKAPLADINIFGMLETANFDHIDKTVETTSSSCLFVRDSGLENIMA